jgi:hypothetical protein
MLMLLDSLGHRILRLLERLGLLIADPEHLALGLEVGSLVQPVRYAGAIDCTSDCVNFA